MKRPIGVTILAILFILSGVIVLGYHLGLRGTPLFFEMESEMSFEGGLDVYNIITAILGIAVGSAMLSGQRWAWPVVIIMVIVALALSIISEVLRMGGGAFWGIVFSIIVLLYMRKSNVKAYFGRIK